MRGRWVSLPIDAVTAILSDYVGLVGFPPDAKPVKWLMNQSSRKLALVVEADSLPCNQPDEEIRFQLKRHHVVGGIGVAAAPPAVSD